MKHQISVLLLCALFYGSSSLASIAESATQNEKIEDLLNAIETTSIEEHPALYLEISELSRHVNRAQAWTYGLKAREFADSLGDKELLADAISNIGSLYSYSESPAEALACFLDALPIYEQLADSANMAGMFLNIGIVYGNQEQPEESASYFERARVKFKVLGNKRGEALALNNLAILAQKKEDFDSALNSLTDALALFTMESDTFGIVRALTNLAENKMLRGNPSAAWPFLEEASMLDSASAVSTNNLYLAARICEAEQRYKSAIRFANQGLDKAKRTGAADEESKLNLLLYHLYKRIGKYELASIHQEAYSANLERLYKSKNDQMIEYLELQSELKSQQTENDLLRKSKELKATELRRRTQLAWLTGLAFLLIGGLAIVLYTNLNKQRFTNEKLVKLNGQISNKNKEISRKTEQLQMANQELESFNFAVSHDLKTPLRSIFSFYQLLERNCGDQLDQDGIECLEQIGMSARQMQGVIRSLLDLSKVNQHSIDRQLVDVGDLAGEVLSGISSEESLNSIQFSTSGNLYAMVDRDLIKILLTNLMGNACKYAAEERPLELKLAENNGVYSICDNGIGFEQQYADRIFKAFQRLHSIDEFEGSGVGLATVERVVRKHGGEVWAVGELDKGASFYFTLGNQTELLANFEPATAGSALQPSRSSS